MKKIFIPLCFLILMSSCISGNKAGGKKKIKFSKKSYQEVLKLAKEEDKIIFIDFWASWCGPCRRMDAEVLADPKLVKFYNSNFINYKMDAESEEAILPKINYTVTSLPTYVWILPNEKMLHVYRGTTTISNFIEQGKIAISRK